MRHVRRGGAYLRVADPEWDNPLDGRYAAERGGRWNPPQSFPVVYLNRELATAQANVLRRYVGLPYGPELLDPAEAPVLIQTTVDAADYVDIVTDAGCVEADLPATYPHNPDGTVVGHDRCQPIGRRAWDAGEPGVACRSAALGAHAGEELARFSLPGRPALQVDERFGFDAWFWVRELP